MEVYYQNVTRTSFLTIDEGIFGIELFLSEFIIIRVDPKGAINSTTVLTLELSANATNAVSCNFYWR